MDSLSQFSLAGKRALITGSSRGIGFALAGALAGTAERHGLVFRLPVEEAAHALLSMAIGLGLQRAITPTLEVSTITDVARALVSEVTSSEG